MPGRALRADKIHDRPSSAYIIRPFYRVVEWSQVAISAQVRIGDEHARGVFLSAEYPTGLPEEPARSHRPQAFASRREHRSYQSRAAGRAAIDDQLSGPRRRGIEIVIAYIGPRSPSSCSQLVPVVGDDAAHGALFSIATMWPSCEERRSEHQKFRKRTGCFDPLEMTTRISPPRSCARPAHSDPVAKIGRPADQPDARSAACRRRACRPRPRGQRLRAGQVSRSALIRVSPKQGAGHRHHQRRRTATARCRIAVGRDQHRHAVARSSSTGGSCFPEALEGAGSSTATITARAIAATLPRRHVPDVRRQGLVIAASAAPRIC